MRLSHAILLGDSLRVRDDGVYLSFRGGCPKGCALGGALLAIGYTAEQWLSTWQSSEAELLSRWPWLTERQIGSIGVKFCKVVSGKLTLEQLADYVRSFEPAEPGEAVSGEGPNAVSERAEILKVKAEELETMAK